MRKQVVRICMLLACAFSFMQGQASIQPSIVKATIDELIAKDAKNQAGITKGVEQVARLWQTSELSIRSRRKRPSFPQDQRVY